MNEVISSYIEESQRTLHTKGPKPPQHTSGILPKAKAGKKLPTLNSHSVLGKSMSKMDSSGSPKHLVGGSTLSTLKSRAMMSISDESHEEALREIDRLMKKNKLLEDELSIITAKKVSFKNQALRDGKELKKLTETLNVIQQDMKVQQQNSKWQSTTSKEMEEEINEMRDTHIREIKLLQRGLKARTDDSQKNRVNEVADLVDSLGRAALQRDRSEKAKQKLISKVQQTTHEIKTLQAERKKYLKQNFKMHSMIQELKQSNNLLMNVGQTTMNSAEPDLSDEEFEEELANFERRYAVLDEGARGLDRWVEKLARDKGRTDKKSEDTSRDIASLEQSVKHWQELSEQKDGKIEHLSNQLREMKQQFGTMQYQINEKSRELQLMLDEERLRYENKLKALQNEVDNTRSTMQGYQVLSEKLQDEIVRMAEGQNNNVLIAEEQLKQNDGSSPYDFEQYEEPVENPDNFSVQGANNGENQVDEHDVVPAPGSSRDEVDQSMNEGGSEAPDVIPGSQEAPPSSRAAEGGNASSLPTARTAREEGESYEDGTGGETGQDTSGNYDESQENPNTGEDAAAEEEAGDGAEEASYGVVAQQAQFAKTGELLQLEVRIEGGQHILYGHELSTNDRYTVPLDNDLVEELDPADPWTELFTVVGISLGPPKELVLPVLVGRREVPLAPSGVCIILTVYKYDNRRFFLNGFDPHSERLVDLVTMEESLTPEACEVIDSIKDDEVLFDFFLGRLQLLECPPEEDEEDEPPRLKLVFNATPEL